MRHLARTLSVGSMGSNFILCVNTSGELLGVEFTPATTDDRKVVPSKLGTHLYGKLYADKGYISQILREYLRTQGIESVYKVRKNMKPQPLSDFDVLLLKKRMLIESVIKEIKTQTQLQHTRHRSFYQLPSEHGGCLNCLYLFGEETLVELAGMQTDPDSNAFSKTLNLFPNSR